MKKVILFSIVCLGLSVFISSCAKVQGCTNATAINYNSAAEKDNGTCIYKGKVTFWTKTGDGFGLITVTMGDGTTGTIANDFSTAPACDQIGTLAYTNVPGNYTYTAEETTLGSNTWSGSVTITSGGCLAVRLN